jgi:dsRNA-specific ribonuclease
MAKESDRLLVEQAFGHPFRNRELLDKALTAAGADGDGDDGNKHLASIGQAALRLTIADNGYMSQMPRGRPGRLSRTDLSLSSF